MANMNKITQDISTEQQLQYNRNTNVKSYT